MDQQLHLALSRELLGASVLEKHSNPRVAIESANRGKYATLVVSLVRFCHDFGCNINHLDVSMLKAIIGSIKSINITEALRQLDSTNSFFDVDLLASNGEKNCFGDDGEWLKLMKLVHFDTDTEAIRQELRTGVPSINFVVDLVSQMHLAEKINLENIFKMYLLSNIKQITSRHVLELFCTELLQRDTSKEILIFTSLLADQRFDQTQFTKDMVWLFKHIRFDDKLTSEVQHFNKQEKSLHQVMKQRTMQNICRGRIRLRDRIHQGANMQWVTENNSSTRSQQALDSFNGWVSRVGFSHTMNKRMKLKAYFIMSQPNIDYENHVTKFFVDDVAPQIYNNKISTPELLVLQTVVGMFNINIQPFDELIAFRRQCFTGFSNTDSKSFTWMQYLQFYVAAYQLDSIWKECWTSVLNILSHQIIVDVERFTKQTPYNASAVLELLMLS
jgi:hypothetical protein